MTVAPRENACMAGLHCARGSSGGRALLAGLLLTGLGCSNQTRVHLLERGDGCRGSLSAECGLPCEGDADCSGGLHCGSDGRCTAECSAETPCSAGQRCGLDGRCEPDGDGGVTSGLVELPDGGLAALAGSACVSWQAEPEPSPSVLMMVVDDSGSMLADAPGGSSKWTVTRAAVAEALDALPGSTAVGLLLYPNQETTPSDQPGDTSQCVNVEALLLPERLGSPGSAQRIRLEQTLDAAVVVNSGTPTHDAYALALEQLESTALAGSRHVLLITDGQPTFNLGCEGTGYVTDPVDEGPILDEVAAARSRGVRTFVIGSPGSESTVSGGADARPWLSRAALLGGTAREPCSEFAPDYCHFDMVNEPDFGVGLRHALTEIVGDIIPCDYPLPTAPPGLDLDLNAVNLVFTERDGVQLLVPRDDDPLCLEGWHFDALGSKIVLCSGSCRRVQRDPYAVLDLFFGCETETLSPR